MNGNLKHNLNIDAHVDATRYEEEVKPSSLFVF